MSQPHDETGEVDSSGNPVEPPRRNEPDGPLEDEDAKSRPGHPATEDNFRGGD
ncbi:hypothetical protein [Amycolatopsis sp. MtRt-6]|uniref:hypothetical protein n=1 Tax=Amycolatopsis sp. MtRt-6 TaxID=2792782 RepID=UPI001A8C2CA1|nr:hypothetical protein [Amycolatopsis sp. MtRt-6]